MLAVLALNYGLRVMNALANERAPMQRTTSLYGLLAT
jgi:hypothetical protein